MREYPDLVKPMNFWDFLSIGKRLSKLESNMATALEKIAALKAAIVAEGDQVDTLVAAFKAIKVEVTELK
jgi:uncharacterized coiled-coil protein SlyX